MHTKTVTLLALAAMACGGGGAEAPVQLTYQFDSAEVGGNTFTATLDQEIDFSMGDHGAHGRREMGARYTIRGNQDSGPNLSGSVQLDTLRASMIWEQSQQRFDTRHLAGSVFPLTVAATGGGAPTYDVATLPVVDMGGQAGGPVPASVLIDYGFPALPMEPVTTGSTWSNTRTYARLEAFLWVTAEVTTTHRATGSTTIDGRDCLMIESESAGTLSDRSVDGETVAYAGQLTGSATWCFDAESGTVVEVIGEELTEGTSAAPDRPDIQIKQTTTIEIQNLTIGGTGGGGDR